MLSRSKVKIKGHVVNTKMSPSMTLDLDILIVDLEEHLIFLDLMIFVSDKKDIFCWWYFQVLE